MPAKTPAPGNHVGAQLSALGQRIRAHRKRQKVSATTAAEAAGMSRVTLHRIESGEPSVTMGAYMSAMSALGLEFEVVDPLDLDTGDRRVHDLPTRIRLDDYPQLKRLAWQLQGVTDVTPTEALNLYERNWRHVDRRNMEVHERALIDALIATVGGGRPLV